MKLQFGRVITAMVTPFDSHGQLDVDQAIKLANHLADNGTDTVLLTGTTGESPTLTHEEEFLLFKEVKSAVGSKVKIMAGTGSNSTLTAIHATQEAEKCGVDGILQVVPYYNKPSQEGIEKHFKTIASETSLPILLYNIPGRTGVNMSPETIMKLSSITNIIGVKEAAGSIEQVAEICQTVPNDFLVYSGDDGLTLPFMEKGAVGVVSVAAHVVGKQIKAMINAYTSHDIDSAQVIAKRLDPIFEVLFITSNPSPVKAALRLLGFEVGLPRLPLVDVNETELNEIKLVLQSLNLK